MGNCLDHSLNFEGSQNTSDQSKTITKTSSGTVPSTITCSPPSNLTAPSYGEKSGSDALITPRTEGEILASSNLKDFTFSELRNATRNFRPDSLLGEGGFGHVYKGWIDEQSLAASKPGVGRIVAIKKLKPEGFQGHKEWLTEVDYLGRLHHPNLVKLIGYCSEGDDRLLVYEFMPKGSLENHLFRRSAEPLSWAIRIKVAVGAARGLSFLHDAESQVIYRDVKASNILVDAAFNAKLSDFGLAKAGPTGDRTHVTTQVMGTHGYAAPEYVATGRLTARADVYSFGVVLLELLSGRRAFDKSKVGVEQNLVDWAKPYLGDKRKLFRIMDTKLEGQYPKKGAYTIANLALQCISHEPKQRPRMREVLTALQSLHDAKDGPKLLQIERKDVPVKLPARYRPSPRMPATATEALPLPFPKPATPVR
ncbi:hypothetical protein KSP39_PZI017056 [Platanthera zijinensis]|uniref:non-specific serine/threonine protein kinase n=1 Tax=Platanthera zijinensis TaxID=2320716 RepID=A0AAP0B6S4_9ASPA